MVNTNCSVYGCYSTSNKNKDLKFHRFPRDARGQLWIDACRRPDLKEKSKEQLYNMHVCGLHFEKWMYMKEKLKSAAIPVLNLPSASMHSISTQSPAPKMKMIDFQKQFDATMYTSTNPISAASTSDQASQTTSNSPDHIPKRRKSRKQVESYVKKFKLEEFTKSTCITDQQFLHRRENILLPNPSDGLTA